MQIQMNVSMINGNAVRKNKALKLAQKKAKKRYGRAHLKAPKMIIRKVVSLASNECVSFVNEKTEDSKIGIQKNMKSVTLPILINALEEQNITGFSGGNFSTAKKINSFANAKSVSTSGEKYIIVNGVECEPGLLHDEWLFQNKFTEIENGASVLQEVFPNAKIFIAVKNDVKKIESKFNLVKVPAKYPLGYENILISSILGINLLKDEVPAEKGFLVLNLQTVFAIGKIIKDGEKISSRYLTVSNLHTGLSFIANVSFGTKIKTVAEKLFPGEEHVFAGGGAMIAHLAANDENVSSETCFIGIGEKVEYTNGAKCKGCGGCSAKCPMKLDIKALARAIEKGTESKLSKAQYENCISCGTCSYLCMAGKDLHSLVQDFINK